METKQWRLASNPFQTLLTLLLLSLVSFPEPAASDPADRTQDPSPAPPRAESRELGLEDCLTEALKNNHRRPASRFAVAAAEAQHRQALAGYWPQVGLKGGYQRMDESPDFLFPSSQFSLPAQTIQLPPGLGIPLEGPGGVKVGTLNAIPVPAQNITIPAQDVKLMNPDSFSTSLQAAWLIYDGGMRKGNRQQTKGLVDMMKEDARRTDLEIMDSVRRYYYGAVLAGQLHQIGSDTLARMEATLGLTETMYKEGSGKVKKTDWLENKIMVESLRSMVALLEKNQEMSRAALANTMGLAWNSTVRPRDRTIPFVPFQGDLDSMVSTAYRFNPDWARVEAGLRAAEGAVRTASSGHSPRIGVTGGLQKWWNNYDAGLSTDRNKEGWTVGVGMEIPLFSGFLTQNRIAETRARLERIKEEQILLKEGVALQIKDAFTGIRAARKSYSATLEAMNAAVENRDLNTRAYQNELVETEKVIRAQLMEALMAAQHYKSCFDHSAIQSQLTLLIGQEIVKQLDARK